MLFATQPSAILQRREKLAGGDTGIDEAARQHADYWNSEAFQRHGPAQNPGIGAEAPLPHLPRDHRNWGGAGQAVLLGEETSHRWLNPENIQESGSRPAALDPVRLAL